MARRYPTTQTAGHAVARCDLYRLLGDSTRLRLLGLCSLEELAVSELAELLGQGQPLVSRQAAALRDGGLLEARRQGTWLLLRLARERTADPVVADAVGAGRADCEQDGTAQRIGELVALRDRQTREFFARAGRAPRFGPPEELAAYLHGLGRLIEFRALAVDVGTGDGALLEVLAPVFERVVALDRSDAQLTLARARMGRLGVRNVQFVAGELEGDEIARAVETLAAPDGTAGNHPRSSREGVPRDGRRGQAGGGRPGTAPGADAVFAARLLHHAPSPGRALRALARLARPASCDRPGGAVLVLDYEPHRDEALRKEHADLWLGFEPPELVALAEEAGLCQIDRVRVPAPWCGAGPDQHLSWQLLVGRRAATNPREPARPTTGAARPQTSKRRSEAATKRAS